MQTIIFNLKYSTIVFIALHRDSKFLARRRKKTNFVVGDYEHTAMSESLSGVPFETRAVVANIYSAMHAAKMPVRNAHRFLAAVLPWRELAHVAALESLKRS